MQHITRLLAYKIDAKGNNIPTPDADSVVVGVLNVAYLIAGITAVIVIVVAGILYATSGGDAGRTKQAREAIIYAVVGLVVVLMAFVITSFIAGGFK